MSQRAKRPNRSEDGSVPIKRRKRTAAEEEEAAATLAAAGSWQPRSNDLKSSSIYNRTTTEAPAELFRKDLISAMKLPDSEPLSADEYWVIVDQWKQEWERGVQVPVNPDSLPEPTVTFTHCTSSSVKHRKEFKLPKNKYIRITKDENFKLDEHALSNAPAQSEAACSYDLDECDVSWLKIFNSERASSGLSPVYEDQLERVLERFELCCWDKIQSILRNEEGLGIEYDENVICDVCRSPDSEEGNEMVFCDSCNICVHQACYGITRIPEGQWLCCTCNIGKRPECVLCPNKGGAMKCTRSGQKWAHVSCALWIPEVSIGCVEKMEPITKISSIPSSRWALICVLCRERVGACIQCSVKTCKTAYHVTCAFKHGLEMRAIIEDENADDGVKLRSYCEKHSKSSKKEKSVCSGSEDDDSKRKKRKDMTSEEKNQARAARLQEIEAEFFKHVTVKDVSIHLDVDNEALQYIYNYWKLKRKAGHNKPLLPPKSEDVDVLSHKREQADLEKMKMFVQLRQDLERVRNLCYMVSRREKLSRSFFRMREQTFHKQAAVFDSVHSLPTTVVQAVIEANHGPSIYDRLYSHNEAEDHTSDFETILARIAGIKSPTYSGDESKPEINGLFKDVKNNPYKKVYFNGASKRRSGSLYGSSLSSASSSDERPKDNKENRLHSSSEDEKPSIANLNKKKTTSPRKQNNTNKLAEKRQKNKFNETSRNKIDSSSEEDVKPPKKEWGAFSRSRLGQVAKELGESGTESDELMSIRATQKSDNQKVKSMVLIYSDSDSSDVSSKNSDKSPDATNDSLKLRTKAAVKEFSHKPSTSKSPTKSSPESKKKPKNDVGKKASTKKKDYVPSSDLIVPQRQAAKKATENLKSTNRVKEHVPPHHTEETVTKTEDKEKDKEKIKAKTKPQSKPIKEVKELPKEVEVKEKKKEHKPHVELPEPEKDGDKADSQEIHMTYVPQRQAAKKAAEHIKSGLGKPTPAVAVETPSNEPAKKEPEPTKNKKEAETKPKIESKKESEPVKPAKVTDSKRKSSTNSTSSSSSSSSSSSDSSTTSSSESEEEPEKPQAQPRSESLFSTSPRETTKRSNAKDWPFLDKGPKSAVSSSSSSDSSDSSTPSSPGKPASPPPQPKAESPASIAPEARAKPGRKSTDKKQPPTPPKREEPVRARGRGRFARGRTSRTSNSGDWLRDANVRPRDLSDDQRISMERDRSKGRKGKSGDLVDTSKKEITESNKLLSPVGKTEKKLKESHESEEVNLEKEIMERKAGKEGLSRTKSALDRLFNSPEKKCDKQDQNLAKLHKNDKTKVEKPKSLEKPSKTLEKTQELKSSVLSEVVQRHSKSLDKLSTRSKSPEKILDKSSKSKSPEKSLDKSSRSKSPEKPIKSQERINRSLERTKLENLIKSPNKEFKEQVDKQPEIKEQSVEKKSTYKKSPSKNKTIDDIFSNKLVSSDTKENKIDLLKSSSKNIKLSEEISAADKILDDHLHSHKEKELYHKAAAQHHEVYNATSENIPKSILNEYDADKKNTLKPTEVLQNRSIFSPQPHSKDDLLDFVNFDDNFGKDDEIIKGPLTFSFNNSTLIKEDTKEDSARETLNLVEKLRMELSKKSTGCDNDDATTSNDVESEKGEYSEQVVPDQIPTESLPKVDAKPAEDNAVDVQIKVTETPAILNELSIEEQHKEYLQQQQNDQRQHEEHQQQQQYSYLNCESNVPLEIDKNIPLQQPQSLIDHTAPIQGDERWVPPSDSYPNIQSVDPTNYLNESVANIDSNFIQQYSETQEHHKTQPALNSLPSSQLDVRLAEEPLKNQSPLLQDRRIAQTPLMDPSSLDCMPSPSPYANIHPQAKWADCVVMPNRRSSSSSAASSSSSSSRREDEEFRPQEVRMVNHTSLDMAAYLPPQVPSFPPNALDNFGSFPDPASQFVPVSLFPPPNLNTQLPFAPAGSAGMFPPAFGAPFPTPHSMPPIPKPVEESMSFSSTCTAAFTSSQHNMAFTAAMVNMPTSTSKPMEQQLEEQIGPPSVPPLTPVCSQQSVTPSLDDVTSSPALSNRTPTNTTLPSPSTSLKSNISSAGKKSPSKPTRTSARVTLQMMNKSPAKSPGKSPRQEPSQKQSGTGRGRGESKRGSGKSGSSRQQNVNRGRARGRGRGRGGHHNDYDYIGANTIHTKLVGTVYDLDFDDDISNDNMADLKSMRERRKSIDIHERKFDSFSTRDSPRSPKFSSPSQTSHKNRYSADLRELRPPTPIEDSRSKTDISSIASSENEPPQIFPDVTPVLPGPVDMRTYNSSFDQQTYNEERNLLSAFATGTTETQVHEDIDEDFEKELHSALTKKSVEPPPAEITSNIKVSLSDSRNQLKVKIKGPIANYTSVPLPPPTVDPIVVSNIVSAAKNNAISSASMVMPSGGTSSLRRMRKKELLRQYWTQDMNMDDPNSNPGYNIVPPAPPISRTIITIPKAVASMTSIPTKEDYQDYRTGSDISETKHHKKARGGLSRELRQLDVVLDDDLGLERRRSSAGSNNSGLSSSFDSNKRRGRPIRPSTQPTAPKLKIKIGNSGNSIVGADKIDDKKDRIRPPKKRLATMKSTTYNVDDLRRESMKFRKKMMADLKVKKKKRDKSEKHRKKCKPEVQIISNQCENPTKLIIRFGKKPVDSANRTSGSAASHLNSRTEHSVREARLSDLVGSAPSDNTDKPPPKLTPIKLKLSRCQEGSYIMKPTSCQSSTETKAEEVQATQPGQPPPPSTPPDPLSLPDAVKHAPPTLPLKKDCEVR